MSKVQLFFQLFVSSVTGFDLIFPIVLRTCILLIGLEFKKGKMVSVDFGWSVLPIFNEEGFVNHGAFQVPLFTGNPTLVSNAYNIVAVVTFRELKWSVYRTTTKALEIILMSKHVF